MAVLITTASPNPAPLVNSSSIGLTGSGFTGATSVTFDGTEVPSFFVSLDTFMFFTAPVDETSAGAHDIVVTSPSGTSDPFEVVWETVEAPVIVSIVPNSGPPGTEVTVTVTNLFDANWTVDTSFVSGTGSDSTANGEDGTYTFNMPSHTPGVAWVTVKNFSFYNPGYGSDAIAFTYEGEPTSWGGDDVLRGRFFDAPFDDQLQLLMGFIDAGGADSWGTFGPGGGYNLGISAWIDATFPTMTNVPIGERWWYRGVTELSSSIGLIEGVTPTWDIELGTIYGVTGGIGVPIPHEYSGSTLTIDGSGAYPYNQVEAFITGIAAGPYKAAAALSPDYITTRGLLTGSPTYIEVGGIGTGLTLDSFRFVEGPEFTDTATQVLEGQRWYLRTDSTNDTGLEITGTITVNLNDPARLGDIDKLLLFYEDSWQDFTDFLPELPVFGVEFPYGSWLANSTTRSIISGIALEDVPGLAEVTSILELDA